METSICDYFTPKKIFFYEKVLDKLTFVNGVWHHTLYFKLFINGIK